jgi:hypothetical protein
VTDALRTILCPVPIKEDRGLVSQIVHTRKLLLKTQKRNGSWGSEGTLDHLVSTCHTLMFLIAAGASPNSRAVKKAARWLQSKDVLDHNNSYWSIGPLGNLSKEHQTVVEAQFAKLQTFIDGRARINPLQSFESFYLHSALATGYSIESSFRDKCVQTIKSEYDKDRGWHNSPATTTGCYVAIRNYDARFASTIRPQVVRQLKSWATVVDPEQVNWGSPILTAYCVMNLVESDLLLDHELLALFGKAVKYLVKSRGRKYWTSANPYGGSGDIKSPEYPTAAVGRALVAALLLDDPAGARASISSTYISNLETSRYFWTRTAVVGFLVFVAYFGFLNWRELWTLFSGISWTGQIAGAFGFLLALVAFFFPKAGPAIWSSLTGIVSNWLLKN